MLKPSHLRLVGACMGLLFVLASCTFEDRGRRTAAVESGEPEPENGDPDPENGDPDPDDDCEDPDCPCGWAKGNVCDPAIDDGPLTDDEKDAIWDCIKDNYGWGDVAELAVCYAGCVGLGNPYVTAACLAGCTIAGAADIGITWWSCYNDVIAARPVGQRCHVECLPPGDCRRHDAAACPAGETCWPDGTCFEGGDYGDGCNFSHHCNSGVCRRPPGNCGCGRDADCGAAEFCVQGQCI